MACGVARGVTFTVMLVRRTSKRSNRGRAAIGARRLATKTTVLPPAAALAPKRSLPRLPLLLEQKRFGQRNQQKRHPPPRPTQLLPSQLRRRPCRIRRPFPRHCTAFWKNVVRRIRTWWAGTVRGRPFTSNCSIPNSRRCCRRIFQVRTVRLAVAVHENVLLQVVGWSGEEFVDRRLLPLAHSPAHSSTQ